MKINTTIAKSDFHGAPVTDDKKGLQKNISFKNQLSGINRSNVTEELLALSEDIFRQGKVVSERCDIKELKKYRELISAFLKDVIAHGFEFEQESGFDSLGRHKIYANIKKIDNRLDKLAAEILCGQKEPVEILKSVEDIKGLILDIFL